MNSMLASVLSAVLIINQTLTPLFAVTLENTFNSKTTSNPVQSLEDAQSAESEAILPVPDATAEFLSEELRLERRNDLSENVFRDGYRDYRGRQEALEFEEAYELLKQTADKENPLPIAVVVKKLTQADLQKLSQLSFEVGGALIDGHIVLFSSFEGDEIRTNEAARAIFDSTDGSISLAFHTHPAVEGRRSVPSNDDIFLVPPGRVEYVAGADGIYAYGSEGLINENAHDYSYLITELNKRYDEAKSSFLARQKLHAFLAEMENPDKDLVRLRAADDPTVFPGHPNLGSFASSSPSATMNVVQSSTSLFRMNYNVTNAGSFAGSFLDFGVDSPANLTGISKFVFNMRTDNVSASGNQLKIEFVDVNNNRGVKFISGLNGTFKQVDIFPAELSGADLSKIKQIVFVIESGMASSKPNGFIEVQSGGIAFDPRIPAVSNPDSFNVTPLPNNSQGQRIRLNSFAASDGSTTTLNQVSPTFFSITYNGAGAGSFGGVFSSYDNPDTIGIPNSETINLNTLFPQGIVLQMEMAAPE